MYLSAWTTATGCSLNHRRQSRDREVIRDVLESLDGKPLYIRPIPRCCFKGWEEAVRVVKRVLGDRAGGKRLALLKDLPLATLCGRKSAH